MAKNAKTDKPKKDRFKGIRQILDVIKLTNELNPKFKIFAPIAFVVPIIVFLVVSIITSAYAILMPLGVLLGLVAFMILLSRMAQSAGYAKVDGEPGASGAVLGQLRLPAITFEEQPVAVDPKTYDLVFRGIGRGGIYFVTEGPNTRVKKLLDKEIAKVKRILPNVPINVINYGNADNQIPLKKLRSAVTKPKFVLKAKEVTQIKKRIQALGGMKLAIPKGMDPNKAPKGMNRRALRGK